MRDSSSADKADPAAVRSVVIDVPSSSESGAPDSVSKTITTA